MLNAYEHAAGTRGWLVISETATAGLVERLVHEHLLTLLRAHHPDQTRSHVTDVKIGPGGVGRAAEDRHAPVRPGLRHQLATLADVQTERGGGVLLTVDEVHRGQLDDLRHIAATVQHLFREERDVAFVAAGLPSTVSDLLETREAVTFLRRADRRHLRAVDPDEVREAIQQAIGDAGRAISEEALSTAVGATGDYPFLIQLVGHHTWRAAGRDQHAPITVVHAERGAALARRNVGRMVHAPALRDLSDVDRSFLVAMSHDTGPSTMGDIRRRLDVSSVYASQYRLRLLEAEMIRSAGHGRVAFTLPGLRDYLRDHAASTDHWDDDIDI